MEALKDRDPSPPAADWSDKLRHCSGGMVTLCVLTEEFDLDFSLPKLMLPGLRRNKVLCRSRPRWKHTKKPRHDIRGGLNRSLQHLLAVYLPEFEIPKFFWDADLNAAPPHRVLLENTLTSLFV